MAFSAAVRGPVKAATLLWVEAKDRDTGDPEHVGFWTGPEDRTFNVDTVPRVYIGGGSVLSVPKITSRAGIFVQTQDINLSGLKPDVAAVVRGLDTRNARVEIHSIRFDPDTNATLALDLVQEGFINKLNISEGSKGAIASAKATVVSMARMLTRSLPLKKSHEAQQLRSNDQFMKYADVSGTTQVFWGMERQK